MPSYVKKVAIPGKSAQELYDRVAAEIDQFLGNASIGDYELDRDPALKEVSFKASMASATLRCTDGQLELDAKLSLLAVPFRSKIDGAIDRWISRTFGV